MIRPYRPSKFRLKALCPDHNGDFVPDLVCDFTHCHVASVQSKDVNLFMAPFACSVQRLLELGNR